MLPTCRCFFGTQVSLVPSLLSGKGYNYSFESQSVNSYSCFDLMFKYFKKNLQRLLEKHENCRKMCNDGIWHVSFIFLVRKLRGEVIECSWQSQAQKILFLDFPLTFQASRLLPSFLPRLQGPQVGEDTFLPPLDWRLHLFFLFSPCPCLAVMGTPVGI